MYKHCDRGECNHCSQQWNPATEVAVSTATPPITSFVRTPKWVLDRIGVSLLCDGLLMYYMPLRNLPQTYWWIVFFFFKIQCLFPLAVHPIDRMIGFTFYKIHTEMTGNKWRECETTDHSIGKQWTNIFWNFRNGKNIEWRPWNVAVRTRFEFSVLIGRCGR